MRKIVVLIIIAAIILATFIGYLIWPRQEENKQLMESVIKVTSAWKGVTNESIPSAHPATFMITPFSYSDYYKVAYSDDDKIITISDPASSGYPYHLFIFNITEVGLTNISLFWEGVGFNEFIGDVEKVDIYLWIVQNLSWDRVANYSCNFTEEIVDKQLYANLSYNLQDYIDENNSFYILVIGSLGAGYSDSNLATDFVKITL